MTRGRLSTLSALVLFAATSCQAAFVEKKIPYSLDGVKFEGVLVYDDSIQKPVPAVLMVPNWMGLTSAAVEKAKRLASQNYVILVADMYGVGVRPNNAQEAGQAAGFVRADRSRMRARSKAALNALIGADAPIDRNRVAAIGFCFGGGTVLELGRSGVELDAIVSFHGDLASPTLQADAGKTKAHVLVLHGADDPYVPQEDVQAFVAAMSKTDVDWQLIQFSNTVHAFTDPSAQSACQADYNPQSAERAYAYMTQLFDAIFW